MEKNSLTLSDEGYLINALVIAALFIIGMAGQIISFIVLLGKIHRQRDFTPYFVNIAVANSLMLVLNFPVIFASSLARRYVLDQTGCYFLGFNAGTTGVVMITTLTCVTVAIYRKATNKSANNTATKQIKSNWRSILAGTWLYSSVLMLPPLFGWGSTVIATGKTSCAPEWRAKSLEDITYLVLLSVFAFLIPLTVSLVCFVKLYRFIDTNQRSNQALSIQQRRVYEHYKTGAKMIGIATVMFFLVWTPYCVFGLASAFTQEYVIQGDVAMIPATMAKSSVIYSPIIYAIVNRRFRNTLLSLLLPSIRRFTQVTPKEESPGPIENSDTVMSGLSLVPRSPLTGISGRTSLQLPTMPQSFRPRARSLSPRSNASIRMLLWPPSFLALKILRAQMSDDHNSYTPSSVARYQSYDGEKTTDKNKGTSEPGTNF